MSERNNNAIYSGAWPYTMNTITAIEDVVSDHFKGKCLAGNMRMLIARIYKHGWQKCGRNTHYTVAAITGQICVLFSGQKVRDRGGGRNVPGGRYVQWP